MSRDHDEDGIIGNRPKRAALDLGPLFAFPPDIGEALAADRAKLEALGADPGPAFDFDSPCALCGHRFDKHALGAHGCPNCHGEGLDDYDSRFDDRDSSWDAPAEDHAAKTWNDENGRAVLDSPAKDAGGVAFVSGGVLYPPTDDAQPLPPHKPEPPTKAERLEAIERIKAAIRDDLIATAKARVPLSDPFAGVTADDAWTLARVKPDAALLGQAPRAWSWLGPWLLRLARDGDLVPFRVRGYAVRRNATARDASHGNAHVVYLHPSDPRAVDA